MGDDIAERLKNIEKLLALTLTQKMEQNDAIKLLYQLDYTSPQIGEMVGLSGSTVRNRISDLRSDGELSE